MTSPEPGPGDKSPVPAGQVRAATAQLGPELELLPARIATGDKAAFAELYDQTSTRVHGLVVRVVRDVGYAEEVTQEVYLQAWRGAAKYDAERGSVLSWLMTLAHRRAVDRVRSEQAAIDRNSRYGRSNVVAAFDTVAEEVDRRSDQRAVLNCLGSLTEVQREAVALAYYGGRSYPEVATQLGVALPTVKSRIRDGLTRLRRCLGVS
ncbi:ECF RNA polymerase sigma factor SigK [Aldersonia kunmingensis]|uniref:ECF RNA polymerase sigma factor SigK n=1 Tax=Aldersonia kunmingensis TaxID=408066 RepID=UPI0009FE06B8|nr:ECF RNA polymerase sigma factor SigK [Aldersonia kunmingensis]